MPKRIRRPWIWRDRPKPGTYADVCRAGPFGNPFKVGPDGDPAMVVAKYRAWATDPNASPMSCTTGSGKTRTIQPPAKVGLHLIRGKDLACFCPLDQPCHADVLLEWANR
jgi:hypothetical protein